MARVKRSRATKLPEDVYTKVAAIGAENGRKCRTKRASIVCMGPTKKHPAIRKKVKKVKKKALKIVTGKRLTRRSKKLPVASIV